MNIKDAFTRAGKKGANLLRIETFLLLFALALALIVFGQQIFDSFMALFFDEFGVPLGEIGLLFTVFSLTSGFVSIPAGFISDRVGRKIVITTSLFFLAAVVFGYSLAETTLHLYILRILHGASFGFIFPVARAYVMDKTTEENRGQTMGAFVFVITMAQMVAPTVGGVLRDRIGSFDTLFYISAVFSLIAALFLMTAVRDFGKGFQVQKMRLPTRELLHNKVFAVILLMFGMLYFGVGIFAPVMAIFAVKELGMSYSLLGVLFTIYLFWYAISQLVAGSLSDKYGRKTLLVYPLFIYAIAMFVSGLSVNYVMFFFAYLCVGIGAAPYGTVAYSLIGDAVEPELRGTASGAIALVQSVCIAVGPIVGTTLAEATSLRVPFFVTACVAFSTIVMLFVLLPKDTKEKKEVEP